MIDRKTEMIVQMIKFLYADKKIDKNICKKLIHRSEKNHIKFIDRTVSFYRRYVKYAI